MTSNATKTTQTRNAGVALLSVAKVMLTEGVCARAACADQYDERRIAYMMNEGMDGELARQLVSAEAASLIEAGDC